MPSVIVFFFESLSEWFSGMKFGKPSMFFEARQFALRETISLAYTVYVSNKA